MILGQLPKLVNRKSFEKLTECVEGGDDPAFSREQIW